MSHTKEQLKKDNTLNQLIQKTFYLSGFNKVKKTEEIEINIGGETSDFDHIFYDKNTIIFVERTIITDVGKLSAHARKKKDFFEACISNKTTFIDQIKSKFSELKSTLTKYSSEEVNLTYLYCSYETLEKKYQYRYSTLHFWDLKQLRYFFSLSSTIKKTSQHEILTSLGVQLINHNSGTPKFEYEGMILPEGASGFPTGYRILSFFVDPAKLLQQAYVLRKHAWLDSDHLYQRILITKKIIDMRRYLVDEKRTFLNNIIATLPNNIKICDEKGNQLNHSNLQAGQRIKIDIPVESSNIGIIDGQHRIFAYHEGDDEFEKKISKLRPKQHLLVTAVLYPPSLSEKEKESFEAKLFLEINDKQTKVKSSLRQVIHTVVDPFSDISIAKQVTQELSKLSPMNEVFETDYFDKGKLSTTSIVTYGVFYVVRLDETESLFKEWKNTKKQKLLKRNNQKLLDDYIKFCSKNLCILLEGFKNNINPDMWTVNQRKSKVLTATTINGLIHCLRLLIKNNQTGDKAFYCSKFKNIESKIDFRSGKDNDDNDFFPYKSSHWKALGEEIYRKCFK